MWSWMNQWGSSDKGKIFLAVGKAWKTTLGPAPGFKGRIFNSECIDLNDPQNTTQNPPPPTVAYSIKEWRLTGPCNPWNQGFEITWSKNFLAVDWSWYVKNLTRTCGKPEQNKREPNSRFGHWWRQQHYLSTTHLAFPVQISARSLELSSQMLQSSGAPRAKGPALSPQQLVQAQQVEKERHDHNLRYGSLIIHWGCVCVCVLAVCWTWHSQVHVFDK